MANNTLYFVQTNLPIFMRLPVKVNQQTFEVELKRILKENSEISDLEPNAVIIDFGKLQDELNTLINPLHLIYLTFYSRYIAYLHFYETQLELLPCKGKLVDLEQTLPEVPRADYDITCKYLNGYLKYDYSTLENRLNEQFFGQKFKNLNNKRFKQLNEFWFEDNQDFMFFREFVMNFCYDYVSAINNAKLLVTDKFITEKLQNVLEFEQKLKNYQKFKNSLEGDIDRINEIELINNRLGSQKFTINNNEKKDLLNSLFSIDTILIEYEYRMDQKSLTPNEIPAILEYIKQQKKVLSATDDFEKIFVPSLINKIESLNNFKMLGTMAKYWVIHECLQAVRAPRISDMLDSNCSKSGNGFSEESRLRRQEVQRQYKIFF